METTRCENKKTTNQCETSTTKKLQACSVSLCGFMLPRGRWFCILRGWLYTYICPRRRLHSYSSVRVGFAREAEPGCKPKKGNEPNRGPTHLKRKVTTALHSPSRMKYFSRQKFGAKTPPLEKYSNFSRQIFGVKNPSQRTSPMPLSTTRMHPPTFGPTENTEG